MTKHLVENLLALFISDLNITKLILLLYLRFCCDVVAYRYPNLFAIPVPNTEEYIIETAIPINLSEF